MRDISCISYLDDIIIISKTKEEGGRDVHFTKQLLESLGLIINLDKSSLQPSQQCKYLGFSFDSQKLLLSLPEKKTFNCFELTCYQYEKKYNFHTFLCETFRQSGSCLSCNPVWTGSLKICRKRKFFIIT